MKHILKLDTINKKLITIFIILTIIPLIITVIVINVAVNKGFEQQVANQQMEMEHMVETQFNNVAEDLLAVTEIYANNDELVSGLQSGNRDELMKEVKQIYPRLQSEHNLDVFEFGDSTGIVVLRGHNPVKYGDDKSDVPAIQHALTGRPSSGFEFGKSGLAVRAFVPVMSDNEVIGTLQTGLDESFITDLQELLQGVTIDLYNGDGVITISSDQENIGQSINNKEILSTVKKGEAVSEQVDDLLISYIPMYDPMQENVIGITAIHQDMSIIQNTNQQIAMIAWLITLITLIVVLLVAIRFSRSISQPIISITNDMQKLSEGQLNIPIKESNRNDELGHLSQAMQNLKSMIHETIKKVSVASSNLAVQSTDLMQSAGEVKSGSEQIMSTMQELAVGAENQADSASELANNMNQFVGDIEGANEKGKEIEQSSLHVMEMAIEGQTLMNTSKEQMVKIDTIVYEGVLQMDQMDKQAQEISQLISVIENIAKQTNLLSLNAQIEAARAGEGGKGFAVVANEVGNLANQVSDSVTTITKLINSIMTESTKTKNSFELGYKEVKEGTALISRTSETFTKINESVHTMVSDMNSVVESLQVVADNGHKVNQSTEEIASISQESAAGVEETSATTEQSNNSMERVAKGAEELAKLSSLLEQEVEKFKI